jgi:hypothetical protein
MIDAYLAELRLLLPVRGRRRARILAEVQAHLRDDAALVGDANAVERFGPPRVVASGFASQLVVRNTRRLLELVAALFLVHLVLLVLIALRPWPSHFGAIEYPRRKLVPVDAMLALGRLTPMFTALAIAGLVVAALAARKGAPVRAVAAGALGLAGLAVLPLLVRFGAQTDVDVSAAGTALRLAGELWALAAVSAAVWAIRTLALSRAAARLPG